MNKELFIHKCKHNTERFITTVKWVIFSILTGTLVGGIGTLFYFCMNLVTNTRLQHPQLLFLLPFGAVTTVALYRLLHNEKDAGTNLVLSAIHSDDEILIQTAPLIFISTLITHLVGGSAGREGAALQLGGSIGNSFGRLFRFNQKDKHIMIMCGMSAAFSALFGTPMAAAIFSMEVVSVGIMHYAALVPCVISALIAHGIASHCGILAPFYQILVLPEFTIANAIRICGLAILCGLVSMLFCVLLHQSEHLYKKFFRNPYIRALVGGCLVLVLTLLVGDQTYNGTGISIIQEAMTGDVRWESFLLKMIFTALTLGAGYKGGEIVPALFIGSTFGCLYGSLLGFSPTLCAAVGMGAVFCGVTNCPITSLFICFELFGLQGLPYFLISIAFSYLVSGYYGLYSSQKIVYSKYKSNYIDKKTQ